MGKRMWPPCTLEFGGGGGLKSSKSVQAWEKGVWVTDREMCKISEKEEIAWEIVGG